MPPINGFFADRGERPVKGKGVKSLIHSKQQRNALIALFGSTELIPSSVMRAKREAAGSDDEVISKGRRYEDTTRHKNQPMDHRLSKIERDAYRMCGVGVENGALSRFPQNVGRSILLLYSDPGCVVFDPFAGHNSRMELCVKEGRNYVGCDLSRDFMAFNRKRAAKLRKLYGDVSIVLHETDSRQVPVADDSADFTITSPPYYDIEYYGDEEAQLGKSATYEEFLRGMRKVMRENFRVLRNGSYCVYFVNDFRRDGKFHLYHADTIRNAEKVGFVPHDVLVVDLGRSIRDCFANQIVTTRILPKRHEYGLVFRKP